jgi:hypothetical protein
VKLWQIDADGCQLSENRKSLMPILNLLKFEDLLSCKQHYFYIEDSAGFDSQFMNVADEAALGSAR